MPGDFTTSGVEAVTNCKNAAVGGALGRGLSRRERTLRVGALSSRRNFHFQKDKLCGDTSISAANCFAVSQPAVIPPLNSLRPHRS
jgi:hypothetical protein